VSPKNFSLAIIGAGRIGQAIIRATRSCVSNIIGTGRRDETLKIVSSLGAEATRDNRLAAEKADIIIISVKPYQFADVALDIKDSVNGKTLISVVAGVTLKTLKQVFPQAKVFRAMPNINALIAKSTTAIATTPETSIETKLVVEELFKCLGSVYWIPEEWMDIWTALVGSGPAFLAEIIDALILGAVMAGMPRELAYKTLLDVIKATATHLESTTAHPLQLRDEVTTPAGTTIYGLMMLESQGVKAGLMKVIYESYERGKKLGGDIDREVNRKLSHIV
jgi:pyrroline-5-carboxylate reductase